MIKQDLWKVWSAKENAREYEPCKKGSRAIHTYMPKPIHLMPTIKLCMHQRSLYTRIHKAMECNAKAPLSLCNTCIWKNRKQKTKSKENCGERTRWTNNIRGRNGDCGHKRSEIFIASFTCMSLGRTYRLTTEWRDFALASFKTIGLADRRRFMSL